MFIYVCYDGQEFIRNVSKTQENLRNYLKELVIETDDEPSGDSLRSLCEYWCFKESYYIEIWDIETRASLEEKGKKIYDSRSGKNICDHFSDEIEITVNISNIPIYIVTFCDAYQCVCGVFSSKEQVREYFWSKKRDSNSRLVQNTLKDLL